MTARRGMFNPDELLEHSELLASKQKLRDVLRPSYWQQLCPGLHVSDQKYVTNVSALKLPDQRLEDYKEQINHAGVTQVSSQELSWSVNLGALAQAIVTLMRYGWPPSLVLVYDEVWVIIKQAQLMMDKATGGNTCNMDILAWYVDPSQGHAGFSPHRDRQPDDSPATFRPDGTAMYTTLWLPLTDATPENSCLYVIPRYSDPGYYVGDPDDDDAPDPLTTALHNKEAYQNIRALPAAKGSATIFTHRTIHWGSRGRPGYPTPRISMSWGCADDAFEPPYFSRHHLPCPPLELRLALAGAQMIVYHERFPAPPKQLALYYQAFTSQAGNFDSGYRAKVMREFVDASKEATAMAAAAAAVNGAAAAPTADEGLAVRSKGVESAAGMGNRSAVTTATAVAAAAAAATGDQANGFKERKRKQREQSTLVPVAADDSNSTKQRKSQKVSAAENSVEKDANTKQKKLDAAKPAASGVQMSKRAQQELKQQVSQQAAAAPTQVSAAAAAATAGESCDEDEEGACIDWAEVAAAARAAAKRAKKAKKHSCKGAGAAALGASSGEEEGHSDGVGFCGDDSSDGDVMDLAMDTMLDAALAGEEGFQDDYGDE